jgi:hypothetical protein
MTADEMGRVAFDGFFAEIHPPFRPGAWSDLDPAWKHRWVAAALAVAEAIEVASLELEPK